jgi:hypothetical protein
MHNQKQHFLDIIDLHKVGDMPLVTLKRVFFALRPDKVKENLFNIHTERKDKTYYTKEDIESLAEKVFT